MNPDLPPYWALMKNCDHMIKLFNPRVAILFNDSTPTGIPLVRHLIRGQIAYYINSKQQMIIELQPHQFVAFQPVAYKKFQEELGNRQDSEIICIVRLTAHGHDAEYGTVKILTEDEAKQIEKIFLAFNDASSQDEKNKHLREIKKFIEESRRSRNKSKFRSIFSITQNTQDNSQDINQDKNQ